MTSPFQGSATPSKAPRLGAGREPHTAWALSSERPETRPANKEGQTGTARWREADPIPRKFTRPYPLCPSFRHGPGARAARLRGVGTQDGGFEVGLLKRVWPQSLSPKLPTLRFRGKVMLGFAVVLAISAASMGIAYLGFEHVSAGVAAYRNSVSEADRARNIDRELISYQALARYYVVTGKEDDAKAGLTAEASLKDAIDQSMRGTTNPARLDQITRLAREFRTFTKIFADILRLKRDSALVTQNQLTRGGAMLRYKLDDLASNAAEAELQAVEFSAKQVSAQYQTATALANTFVINSDQTVATSALARLKFVENSLKAISSTDEKIGLALKELSGLLDDYRNTLTKLVENAKAIADLTTEIGESAEAIMKGAGTM